MVDERIEKKSLQFTNNDTKDDTKIKLIKY